MSTKATELLAPVPSAADYSVSADLWARLEKEILSVSARIDAGENLVPEDVVNVRRLKNQVDNYVIDFNKAMKEAQSTYKKMIESRLKELEFDKIEQFVIKKRQEQSELQNTRISIKMDGLKEILNGLLEHTECLKNVPMSKELLPAFTARFPKIQSGAKNNDITDWTPYFAIMSKVITLMDAFFCDTKYKDAVLLPIQSGTIRELLAYAKDGRQEHLANVPLKYKEDEFLIRTEKLKQELTSKAVGIEHIRKILDNMGDISGLNDIEKQVKTDKAWEEISQIVRLCKTI